MGIVYVTHLEAGTLTRQTARTQGRQTTLVRHLGQRVGLVHELRERVRTEERVDNARDSLGVDQIGRSEHLIVAHVHALTDGTAHTVQTDRELVGQLLAHRAYTTVRQVVDIIHSEVAADEGNQILDDGDDVILRQHVDVGVDILTQLLVDTVTTYLAQVVTLVREEQVLYHLTCTCLVGRVCVTQLTVDVVNGLLLGV